MKHPHNAVVRILSLLLLLTLLPLPAGPRAKRPGILADIELTDLQQLENVRTALDKPGCSLQSECALLVDAMLIMARDDIFQMGQASLRATWSSCGTTMSLRLLQRPGALPSLADLAEYAKPEV